METVYYYIVQPGDNLWKISKELYGDGSDWKRLFNYNRDIFDPDLIYPDMKLEISGYIFPKDADERFITEERKKINYEWSCYESYVNLDSETSERAEYPKETEKEALKAFKEGRVEDWLSGLTEPELLTEEEKEEYRKKDSDDILYSYETERGLPEDRWYIVKESDGESQLIIENRARGKYQEFYGFIIDSDTGEIVRCKERIHGAGGRLYLTEENGIRIWILTKEMNGKVTGIAGDYRGWYLYIGGNFYYEKQKNGTIKEHYQEYASIGKGTMKDAVGYPY
ncbi:MAG: LysM peptidoglycan-binding domain-containing protein [Lachnospiraceae bacterium]|nr:LysM peptidoglycan-binding domain-containing protein [Lachnospiraceae bacterium]